MGILRETLETSPLGVECYFLCSSLSSFSDISMNFWVPTLFRYAKSPALVKTLFCPCAGSNWFTNKSHGESSQTPQCSTLPVAQACSLHSPQKGCPFWLPHPEQLGFSFLFKKAHVPQYVPQGATSLSSIQSASGISRLALLLLVSIWLQLFRKTIYRNFGLNVKPSSSSGFGYRCNMFCCGHKLFRHNWGISIFLVLFSGIARYH